MCNDDMYEIIIKIFLLINILNVLELGTGGIDLQNEVVAFYEMLGDTVPEGLEESMRMVSRTSDLLS